KKWSEIFNHLLSNDLMLKVKQVFDFLGYRTLTIIAIKRILFESESVIVDILGKLIKQKYLTEFTYKNAKHYVSSASMDRSIQLIESEIDKMHEKNKLKRGFNFQQLFNMLKPFRFSEPFLNRTLERAIKSERITFNGSEYNSSTASKDDGVTKIKQDIIKLFRQCRYTVPDVTEAATRLNIDIKTLKDLIVSLTQNGELKSIGAKFYLHQEMLDELIEYVRQHFKEHKEIDVGVLRDFTGCSRKYLIPLFEYLDSNGFTERQGDVRVAGTNL
ncbi:MAG: SelB C-terminal domain-containing protein, partial [Calditrichaceae bacterium]